MSISIPSDGVLRRFAPLLLLVLGSLWGLNTSMLKMAGLAGGPPIGLSTLQMTGAAIALTLFCRIKGVSIGMSRAHLLYYLNVGVLGTAVASVNLVNTLRELPAGVMVLCLAMIPLITYGASVALRMERFDLLRFLGVVCGLVGVLLIVLPKASLPRAEDTFWFLMGMITPICYTYSNLYAAKYRPPNSTSVGLSAGMFGMIAVAMWPTAMLFDQVYIPAILHPDIATVSITVVIVITCIAYFIYFEMIQAIGAVGVSVVGYIVTLTGIIFGMIFFDEAHSAWVWASAALIFVGLALVNGRQSAGALIKTMRD